MSPTTEEVRHVARPQVGLQVGRLEHQAQLHQVLSVAALVGVATVCEGGCLADDAAVERRSGDQPFPAAHHQRDEFGAIECPLDTVALKQPAPVHVEMGPPCVLRDEWVEPLPVAHPADRRRLGARGLGNEPELLSARVAATPIVGISR